LAKRLLSYFRELPRERQDDFMRIAQTLHRQYAVKHAAVKAKTKKSA
jgi:hypothetical protein